VCSGARLEISLYVLRDHLGVTWKLTVNLSAAKTRWMPAQKMAQLATRFYVIYVEPCSGG
jgi:hypothetical protein